MLGDDIFEVLLKSRYINISRFYSYIKERGNEFVRTGNLVRDLEISFDGVHSYGKLLSQLGLVEKQIVSGTYPVTVTGVYRVSPAGTFISSSDFENIVGITPLEFEHLRYIVENGPSSPSDLSGLFLRGRELDKREIGYYLRRLERKEYLTSRSVRGKTSPWIFSLAQKDSGKNGELRREERSGVVVGEREQLYISHIREKGKVSVSDMVKRFKSDRDQIRDRLKTLTRDGLLQGRKRKMRNEFFPTEKGERTVYFWTAEFPLHRELMRYPRLLRLEAACAIAEIHKIDSGMLDDPYARFFAARTTEMDLLEADESFRRLRLGGTEEDLQILSSLTDHGYGFHVRLGDIVGRLNYKRGKGEFSANEYSAVEAILTDEIVQGIEEAVDTAIHGCVEYVETPKMRRAKRKRTLAALTEM